MTELDDRIDSAISRMLDTAPPPVDVDELFGARPSKSEERGRNKPIAWRVAAAAALLLVVGTSVTLVWGRNSGSTVASDESVPLFDSAPSNTGEPTDVLHPKALSQFEECLEILETPEQPGLVVEQRNGRVIVEGQGEFDPRVTVCRDVLNTALDLRETGASGGKSGPISPAQTTAIAGGVTETEYETAFDRLADCMQRAGGLLLRDSDGDGYNYTHADPSFDDAFHEACYQWHFERLSTIWLIARSEAEQIQALDQLAAAEIRAQEEILAGEADGQERPDIPDQCVTAFGDGAWITTFDSMPQPLCVVVGEEHDLAFWNKGFATASVDWNGETLVVSSGDSFPTGRIGDTFSPGVHYIEVDPYGVVDLIVIPKDQSRSALLSDQVGWTNEALLGTHFNRVAELLGIEFVFEPSGVETDMCWDVRIAGDPYSPTLAALGDGTPGGSLYLGLASETARCG